MTRHCNYCIGCAAAFAVLVFISASALLAAGQTSVTTYHYDNYRTGWNQNESMLTPANVGASDLRSAADRAARRPGGRAAAGGARACRSPPEIIRARTMSFM